MRRVWIAAGALVILFFSIIFYVRFHKQTREEILVVLEKIAINAQQQDASQISPLIEDVHILWKKNHLHWIVLFGKDMVDPMNQSLHSLQVLATLQMYDELILEVQNTIVHIDNIWQGQWVSLESIF